MVKYRKINGATKTGKNRDPLISAERLVNAYVEESPQTGSNNYVIHGTPGQTLFCDIGDEPIYAMHSFAGNLYVVTDDTAYVVDSNGIATSLGSVGTIDQNIQILDNSVTAVILDNSTGSAYTATSSSLNQIVDADFRDASSMAYIDGYMAFTERGSDIWFISDLRDATSYNALDFTRAEADSDNGVRIFASFKEIIVFGERSVEFYSNTGNVDFPFEPQQGVTLDQGCGALLSVAQIKDNIMWLGEDGEVFAMRGYTPQKVSTPAIDDLIGKIDDFSDAFGFTYSQNGHNFYVLTFPGELTISYDINTGGWHERKTFEKNDWRTNCHAFFAGKNLVGSADSGKIYELDLNKYTDDGVTIERIMQTPPLFAERNKIFADRIEVAFNVGQGLLSGQGSDPVAFLSVSEDGGRMFGNELFESIGERGRYRKVSAWRRLGSAKNMTFKIKVTDPVKFSCGGIYAWVTGGSA